MIVEQEMIDFLEKKIMEYNQISFIEKDPISIPHRFHVKQDIEIAGFFSAHFAWGNRTTIIKKSLELMQLMDDAPFDFIQNHQAPDLKRFEHFKHRTFQFDDLCYFIHFLNFRYSKYDSLEQAYGENATMTMKERLIYFHHYFFSLEHLTRTRKHISTPAKNAACKRQNMFLRWMVRKDKSGVDFGIWNQIKMSDLHLPLDVHVANVSYHLGILNDKKSSWINTEKLTHFFREITSEDPAKFDFALFSLGVEEGVR